MIKLTVDRRVELIELERRGSTWAVKHRGGILGYATDSQQALAIGESLVAWLKSEGRRGEVVIDGLNRGTKPGRSNLDTDRAQLSPISAEAAID